MEEALSELVRISRAVGSDSRLVLGGFGNTSVKTADGRYMYIKASGTALKEMTETKGWRRLRVESVLAILKAESTGRPDTMTREATVTRSLLLACEDGIDPKVRPSIESCFHAIMDRYVIHLHPFAVLAYACAKKGKEKIQQLFRNEKPPVWAPYADPGYGLARRIESLTRKYKRQRGESPELLFLQNHGLIVTAGTADTAMQLVRKAVGICAGGLRQQKAHRIKNVRREAIREAACTISRAIFETSGRNIAVQHFTDETIAAFMARKDAAHLCSLRAITPDELIYANGPPLWLESRDLQSVAGKLKRCVGARGQLPAGFILKPLGLFIAANEGQSLLVKEVLRTCLEIRSLTARLGGVRPLSKRQQDFILALAGKGGHT